MAPQLDLCANCRRDLPTNDPNDLDCPPCLTTVVVPFRYAYPVDHFIRALKFRGERMYARVLGTLLADAILHMRGSAPLPEVLVPVPLHASRYRARGFNQAHEIARFAAVRLGLRVEARYLARVTPTQEQSGLPLAERIDNVRGAFAFARPLATRHIALVDDVLTTGSTAHEAAKVLQAAGAESIELWAAARVTLD
jgi:ComF family protein